MSILDEFLLEELIPTEYLTRRIRCNDEALKLPSGETRPEVRFSIAHETRILTSVRDIIGSGRDTLRSFLNPNPLFSIPLITEKERSVVVKILSLSLAQRASAKYKLNLYYMIGTEYPQSILEKRIETLLSLGDSTALDVSSYKSA